MTRPYLIREREVRGHLTSEQSSPIIGQAAKECVSFPDWLNRYAERFQHMYGRPLDKAQFLEASQRNRNAAHKLNNETFDQGVEDLEIIGR